MATKGKARRELLLGPVNRPFRVVIMGLWFRIESRNGKIITSSEQYSRTPLKISTKVAISAGWPLYREIK